MKRLLLLGLLLFLWNSYSQIGIGTTVPSATLDITASNQATPANNDGLLIPRVNAFPSTLPTPIQNGMMVFLTTPYGIYQPGFYYWDSPSFSWIGVGENNEWKLNGNNVNSAVHYIGTKNNSDLVFKRNGNFSGHIGLVNLSLGLYSMPVSATSSGNTAIGNSSLGTNSGGSYNTALGSGSLYSNQGNWNVGVGISSLFMNSLGGSNTAIGSNSLTYNTNGNNNVANGFDSLNQNANGSNNTAVGTQSLRSNDASNNTAVGFNSLYTNYTGTENTAAGYRALYSNYAGGSNSAFGANALYSSNGGLNNSALGHNSLYTNSIGSSNTATGQQALYSNTIGNENTASGSNALRANSSGNNNSAFGVRSLYNNSIGVNNVANGFESLYSNTTGNYNVALGSGALYSNTNGVHNTAIGMNANVSTGGLGNATTIGAYAFATTSNSLILGGILGVNGSPYNTNVGIGTTAPLDRLHVVGNIRMADGNQAIGKVLTSDANGTASWQTPASTSSYWSRSSSGQLYPTTITDNIGIGTATPLERLHVMGNIRSSNLAGVGSRIVAADANGTLTSTAFGTVGQVLTQTAGGPAWQNQSSFWSRSISGQLYPSTITDNIGIGIATPNAPLQFSNTVVNRKIVLYDTNNNDNQYYGFGINGATLRYQTDALAADHVFFAAANSTTSNELMRIKGNGNVGIGINPAYRLDVVGFGGGNVDFRTSGRIWINSTDGGIWLNNLQDAFMGNISTTQFGFWSSTVGWSAFNITKTNGFIGIGTTTPAQKVDIIGKIKITDGTQGAGKVLSSDANGVGTWVNNTAITPAVIGTFAGGGANFGSGTSVGVQSPMTYCNVYIDLPVGKWIVFGTYLLAGTTSLATGQSVFIRTALYTSNVVAGSNPDIVSGALVSGTLAGPSDFGLANGQTIINNTSGATKRYYLWANIQKFGTTPITFTMAGVGSNFWSENQLSAIPTN